MCVVPAYKVGFCMSGFCSACQCTQEIEGGQEEKVEPMFDGSLLEGPVCCCLGKGGSRGKIR